KKGIPRPPVVSVLGHIDHGKTTLLDAIRHSHLAAKEAGGITQGVAAYQADLHGKQITFIDTPGHKAFTGMRARGAKATDIAILVVAADDGVMAQTIEAIDHIHAANIPMIVAINKIDKPNADIDKVMNDLTKHGLTPEVWGGDTVTVSISALKGENIEDLLEMILLVAEMEDLRADPDGKLEAIIIESHLSKGQGPVATVVIKNGTLQERDNIVAGSTYGRVKALTDERGKRVHAVGPGKVAEVVGLQEVPPVGTLIEVVKTLGKAKEMALKQRAAEEAPRQSRAKMNVEDLFRQAMEEEKLQLILKASSTGALEAAQREIEALAMEEVKVEFLHVGVGDISESDILLATSVSGTCLAVGFGVKADPKASRLAEREGVMVRTYNIIYDLIAEVERTVKRMVGPEYEEVTIGEVEVRDLFKISDGVVAGCYVAEGKVARRGKVRVMRDGEEVFVGEIASLHRFANDVREVQAGRECGIRIQGFDEVEVGDRLIIFNLEGIAG
ncbi:MAG: translation initiation factor IF-2, partial [Planctomycetes bacterium]|nr:translation initiation factor IF-2 [Planctomycetota bacterium]